MPASAFTARESTASIWSEAGALEEIRGRFPDHDADRQSREGYGLDL